MKKFLSFALCISFCLLVLPFSAYAELVDLDVDKAVYMIGYSDGTASTYRDLFVNNGNNTVPKMYSVSLASPSTNGGTSTLVINGNFLVGAEYTVQYVLYNPNFVSTGVPSVVVRDQDYSNYYYEGVVSVELVDPVQYPNPFSTVSDSDYAAGAYLYTVTITPEFDFYAVIVAHSGYYDQDTVDIGAWYLSASTTYEEAQTWYLSKIFDRTGSILDYLNGSLTTLLNSLHSTVTNGFDTLHQDLTNLMGAIGNGLQMTEEDEQDFANQEAENEAFNDAAAEKQEQQNQALQQQQQTNQQKQDQAAELEDQRQQFEQSESDFKGSYGGTADFDSINESINQQLTGEYGGALIWWGEVFGEFFSFAPLKTMLNVAVFFGLLMLLFGVGTRAGLRVSARERRTVKHSD